MIKVRKIAISLLLASAYSYGGFWGSSSSSSSVSDFLNCLGDGIDIPSASGMCGATEGLTKAMKKDFSVGGCSISAGGSNSCFTNGLSSLCNNAANSAVQTPSNLIAGASNKFNSLKGDGFPSDPCKKLKFGETKYPSGKTQDQIYEDTSIEKMSGKTGIFSSRIDDIRDCMKINGDKCLEEGYMKLPATSLDTQKEVIKSASFCASADAPCADTMASLAAETSKKLKECDSKNGEAQEECKDKVLSGSTCPAAKKKKALARIELASAGELNIMQKSARGTSYYVYKDQASIDKLPREVRGEYSDGVARQNAADTLIASYYNQIVKLKKDAVTSDYERAEACSFVCNKKAAIFALDTKMTLLGEEDKSNDSAGTGGLDAFSSSSIEGAIKDVTSNMEIPDSISGDMFNSSNTGQSGFSTPSSSGDSSSSSSSTGASTPSSSGSSSSGSSTGSSSGSSFFNSSGGSNFKRFNK